MINMDDENQQSAEELAEVSEEEIIETIEEEETPLDLPQEKRRVYSDKNDRSIFELYRRYQRGDLNLDPEFKGTMFGMIKGLVCWLNQFYWKYQSQLFIWQRRLMADLL